MIESANQIDKQIELIERCKKGYNSAFKLLYDQHVRAMFNVCVRMLGNKDDAKDVLQNSFIHAFTSIQNLDTDKFTFGAWLKGIVINKSLEVLNTKSIAYVTLDNIEDVVDEKEESGLFYSTEEVENAIEHLPPGSRIVLTLALMEQYSHKKIASILKISESTSKSQFFRGRKQLIDYLSKNTK